MAMLTNSDGFAAVKNCFLVENEWVFALLHICYKYNKLALKNLEC
jgi:hypothetical protein